MATDPIGVLAAALDEAVAVEPTVLGDGEAIVALHRQLERLEAVFTRAVAAFDAGGTWSADGARTAAAWVATKCRQPFPTTRARVRLGRELRHMAETEESWLAGDIGRAQVGVLAEARRCSDDCFERDESLLVGQAQDLQYRHFANTVAYWCQLADPDGAEAKAKADYQSRRLHLSKSWQGRYFLDGIFDPIGGEIFATTLEGIEKEFFDADWAEAKARLGDQATTADLTRTPAQRRADAAVEMARRAAAVPEGARRPEPLFTVFVGYETFAGRICELAGGAVVSPGSLVPWLEEAWVERVVFDGPDRIKNVGRAPPDLRRGHPAGGGVEGPGVLPRVLRPARRRLRDRPRPALVRGRAHHRRERSTGLQLAQPLAAAGEVAAVGVKRRPLYSSSSSARRSMRRPSCQVPSAPRSYCRITPTGLKPTLA